MQHTLHYLEFRPDILTGTQTEITQQIGVVGIQTISLQLPPPIGNNTGQTSKPETHGVVRIRFHPVQDIKIRTALLNAGLFDNPFAV